MRRPSATASPSTSATSCTATSAPQTRLDFTVIGPAVNTAARLEGLTKVLKRHVLISSTFAYACACSPDMLELLGTYPLRGVGEPLGVFGLVGEE